MLVGSLLVLVVLMEPSIKAQIPVIFGLIVSKFEHLFLQLTKSDFLSVLT